jgi:hypothetical protein
VTAARASEEAPLDGALAVSDPAPAVGERIVLYVNATAQSDVPQLRLEVMLPDGMRAANGAAVEATFRDVRQGQTVTLAVPVEVATAAPRRVIATATVAERPTLALRSTFVLDLNGTAATAPPPKEGTDRAGRPLGIYESGR